MANLILAKIQLTWKSGSRYYNKRDFCYGLRDIYSVKTSQKTVKKCVCDRNATESVSGSRGRSLEIIKWCTIQHLIVQVVKRKSDPTIMSLSPFH